MNLAHPLQTFQDWFTQQWVILWGRRIDPETHSWLMSPFGTPGVSADHFAEELAAREGLIVQQNSTSRGIISNIAQLGLTPAESDRLSKKVVDFYENTEAYSLQFNVRWNPLFVGMGKLVTFLFSNRLRQLNIPTKNDADGNGVSNEIITLKEPGSDLAKYTIWYRTFKSTGKVLYAGVYSTCILPTGRICVKAVFPLPHGNATVIMSPSVDKNGGLSLDASGQRFGDPGFYFLLRDSRDVIWSHYIRSFRDYLNVYEENESIRAAQTLTLWHQRVLQMNYYISTNQ